MKTKQKPSIMYANTMSAKLNEYVGRIQPPGHQFPASTTQAIEALFGTWKSLTNNLNGWWWGLAQLYVMQFSD